MEKEEIIKKLEERKDLADRAYNTYQQLQGQIALLRDMLKDDAEKTKASKEKKDKGTPTEEVKE